MSGEHHIPQVYSFALGQVQCLLALYYISSVQGIARLSLVYKHHREKLLFILNLDDDQNLRQVGAICAMFRQIFRARVD
jgi:hypothetical protein